MSDFYTRNLSARIIGGSLFYDLDIDPTPPGFNNIGKSLGDGTQFPCGLTAAQFMMAFYECETWQLDGELSNNKRKPSNVFLSFQTLPLVKRSFIFPVDFITNFGFDETDPDPKKFVIIEVYNGIIVKKDNLYYFPLSFTKIQVEPPLIGNTLLNSFQTKICGQFTFFGSQPVSLYGEPLLEGNFGTVSVTAGDLFEN